MALLLLAGKPEILRNGVKKFLKAPSLFVTLVESLVLTSWTALTISVMVFALQHDFTPLKFLHYSKEVVLDANMRYLGL
jgi:hypothetical protein